MLALSASTRTQVTRFLGVGVVNTLVAFVTFRAVLAVARSVPGAPVLAQTVATAVAMCCSYLLNRGWTFRSAASPGPELARFVASQGVMLVLSSALLEATIDGLHLPPTLSWIGVTAVMTGLNFAGQRYWVFRTRPRAAAAASPTTHSPR